MNAWDAVLNGITAFANWKVVVAFFAYLMIARGTPLLSFLLFGGKRPAFSGFTWMIVCTLIDLVALPFFLGSTVLIITKLGSDFTFAYAIEHVWELFGAALVGFVMTLVFSAIPIIRILVNAPLQDSFIGAIPIALYLAFGGENLFPYSVKFIVENFVFILLCIVFIRVAIIAFGFVLGGLTLISPAFDPDSPVGDRLTFIFLAVISMVPIFATVNLAVHNRLAVASSSITPVVAEWPELSRDEQLKMEYIVTKMMYEELSPEDIQLFRDAWRSYLDRTGMDPESPQVQNVLRAFFGIIELRTKYEQELGEMLRNALINRRRPTISQEFRELQSALIEARILSDKQAQNDLARLEQVGLQNGRWRSVDGQWYEINLADVERGLQDVNMVMANLERIRNALE